MLSGIMDITRERKRERLKCWFLPCSCYIELDLIGHREECVHMDRK